MVYSMMQGAPAGSLPTESTRIAIAQRRGCGQNSRAIPFRVKGSFMAAIHSGENPAPGLRTLQAVALFAVILILYVVQCHTYFLDPVLFGKDAGLTFPYFYGATKGIGSIYLKSQGYFSFVLYFFPWLFAHFPTAWQPALYTCSAAAFVALPVAFLAWSTLFREWTSRFLLIFVIAFWHYWANGRDEPGTIFVLANMSFWPACLLFYLIVLQLLAERARPVRVLVLSALAVPLLLSHPYTIAALPTLGYLVATRTPKTTRACAAFLILLSLVYATTHEQGKTNYGALLSPQTILDYIQYLVNAIVLLHLTRLSRPVAVLFAALVIVVLILWYWRRPRDFHSLTQRDGFILLFIAGVSAIFFASYRYTEYGTSVPLRYSYVQQNLWLIFLLRRLDRLPRPVPWPALRIGLCVTFAVIVLVLRGLGGPSSFIHLHTHEAAVQKELYVAMGIMEATTAAHPEVAFLIFVPNHNWPTRTYFIGDKEAGEIVDFCHTPRRHLADRLEALDLDQADQARVLAAHRIYGVENNFITNGTFAEWQGGQPVSWDIEGQGQFRIQPETVGVPALPVLAMDCDAPESAITLSQTVTIGPQPEGAQFRLRIHSLQEDANRVAVTFFTRGSDGWEPFAEREGSSYHYWLRQTWDARIPDTVAGDEIRFSITFRPKADKVHALTTNVMVTVLPPGP